VATALGVTTRTIEHLKERFVEDGLDAALARKPRTKPANIATVYLSLYNENPFRLTT
jgi:transposase